jgi:hypothetical protein
LRLSPCPSRRPKQVASAGLAFLALIAVARPAEAGLGRNLASVREDRDHFGAALSSTSSTNFTVHTLSLANGGTLREFTNSAGVVFAVAWRGPARPDLQQLLGEQFATVQSAPASVSVRRGRRALVVQGSGLVVHSLGRPGAFWGTAYLPQDLPSGFSGQDLR